MTNQAFDDPTRLRQVVMELIKQGRVRLTLHARETHPEIPNDDKVAAIRLGSGDKPNRQNTAKGPSYVCWYQDPTNGLLRGVYAILGPPKGGQVLIISVFPE